ncbi:hypothetical protein Tco_0396343 [Tanacetum coccineum]
MFTSDSTIALSPGYIADSYLEDESDDGPKDYPTDEGDDNDSSGDDADDEDEEEASEEDKDDEEEEEDEHLAPADSTATASPVVDLVSSAKETEPFETDESAATPPPPPAYCTTTRMSIIAQTPIPFLSEAEVDRLLAIPTPPLSPLTLLSSPLLQIPSPPFLVPSPPTTGPTDTKAPLGYKEAGIRLRTASPPPLPLSPPLPLPPPIILLRTRASLVLMRKRLCISLGPRFEVRESSSSAVARSTRGFRADYGFVGTLDAEIRHDTDRDVGYGITNIWVDPAEAAEEIPPTTLAELNRRYHANIALLVDREAKVARKAWAQSMDASHRAHFETQIVVLQRQRIEDSDMLTQHIQHEHDHFREFQRTRDDAPEDANSS